MVPASPPPPRPVTQAEADHAWVVAAWEHYRVMQEAARHNYTPVLMRKWRRDYI